MRTTDRPFSSATALTRAVHRLRPHAQDQRGDTLIEVVIAAAILLLVVLGALGGFDAAGKASITQRQAAQADAVAQQDEERLRSTPVATIISTAGSGNATTVTEAGTTFGVYHTASYEADATGAAPCSANTTGSADYLRTDSYVTWPWPVVNKPGQISSHTVNESSVVTPSESAALVVHDTDVGGNPIALVNVTVSQNGSTVSTAQTDASGCAIFTSLTDGTYTVAVSQTGDIDQTQNPSPSQSATVVTGESTPITFTYAPAAFLTPTFTSVALSTNAATLGQPLTGTPITTTGDSFTVYNSQTIPTGTIYTYGTLSPTGPPTQSSVATTTPGLFPFSYISNSTTLGTTYTAWAGGCSANDPAKVNAANTDQTVALTPGSTPALALYEPPVVIRINNALGVGYTTAPTNIHVTDLGTGTGCTSPTRVYTVANGGLAANPTTSSTGALNDPDLPYGSYSVCVDMGTSPGTTHVTVTGLKNQTASGLTPPSSAVTVSFLAPVVGACSP
jgi:Tfp pilus assembly protein PilV